MGAHSLFSGTKMIETMYTIVNKTFLYVEWDLKRFSLPGLVDKLFLLFFHIYFSGTVLLYIKSKHFK